DRAGVVDEYVDAAETADGLLHSGADLVFFANVALDRQRLAADRLDRRGGAVDRAGQFRIRHVRLRRNRNVGAVARRAQRDGETDAARRAGDEQGLALQ